MDLTIEQQQQQQQQQQKDDVWSIASENDSFAEHLHLYHPLPPPGM